MAVSTFTPNEDLVGPELSTITRLIEATKVRETAGTKDEKLHEAAAAAADALMKHAGVAVEGLEALKELATKYKEAGEKQKMDPHPNVKSDELINLIRRLEGYLAQSKAEDKDGGKKQVHPAANPPGDEHLEDKPKADEPATPVKIVETPESKKAEDKKKK